MPGAEDLAAAERFLLVQYTPEERAQAIENIGDLLDLVRARRMYEPDNGVAPATIFDPRLPGRTFGPAKASPPVLPDAPKKPPGRDIDLAYAPVCQLAAWVRDGQVTSERLVRLSLDRLKAADPQLHCVITLMEDEAMAAARVADAEIAAGKWRGPLHGIPWGAKDLLDTKGVRTTWGAKPYEDRVPDRDAVVVRRLRDAGAVLVAKLTLGALAYGDLWFGGRTRNPWNPEEGSSGSSAGPAAATVAGLVGFGVGSETLGSIVSPSMRCGTTGLRPTFGRVARTGAMALCWSLDKLGPITRSVDDAALVLQAMNGADPGDPASYDVPLALGGPRAAAGRKVGYDPAWFDKAEDLDQQALDALKGAGADLVEVKLPEVPWEGLLLILSAEAAAAFEALTFDGRDDDLVWQGKQAWPNTFRQARLISAVDLVQAERLRRHAMEALDGVMSEVDALISPSYGSPLLVATNFTGHPTLTVRTGFVQRGDRSPTDEVGNGPKHRVPYGITLWGRLYDEGTLVRLGRALEAHFDVAAERPPGFA